MQYGQYDVYIYRTRATRERGNEVQMFLFKRMNKMIQTGNNGRGPGGPRLPSDRRSDFDDRWLNIPAVGISSLWNSIGHCG